MTREVIHKEVEELWRDDGALQHPGVTLLRFGHNALPNADSHPPPQVCRQLTDYVGVQGSAGDLL
jgi:hypothetical protein